MERWEKAVPFPLFHKKSDDVKTIKAKTDHPIF